MIRKIITGACLIIASNLALAGTVSGRTVSAVGCYDVVDGTCFAILSGAAFGPGSCNNTQVRFLSTATNGGEMLATFMLAQSSEKKVSLSFSDSTCFGPFPKLKWVFSSN